MTEMSPAAITAKRSIARAEMNHITGRFDPETNTVQVPSQHQPGVVHAITAENARPGEMVHFHCTCKSGEFRSDYLVACVHAAAAGLLFKQHGIVDLVDRYAFVRIK